MKHNIGRKIAEKVYTAPNDDKLEDDPLELFYNVKEIYEITVNPCNGEQGLDGEPRIYHAIDQFDKNMTKSAPDDIDYIFTTEISEVRLTQQNGSYPRIHFHGIIRFNTNKSLCDFLLYGIRKLQEFGRIAINKYRPDYWPKYMIKQREIVQPYCKKYRIYYYIKNNISIGYYKKLIDLDIKEDKKKCKII